MNWKQLIFPTLLSVTVGCADDSSRSPDSQRTSPPANTAAFDDTDQAVYDAFVDQALTALFNRQTKQDSLTFLSKCEVSIHRREYSEMARIIEDTMTEEELKSGIRVGELQDLRRDGQCWEITVSQYPWTAKGYLNDGLDLVFLVIVPEG